MTQTDPVERLGSHIILNEMEVRLWFYKTDTPPPRLQSSEQQEWEVQMSSDARAPQVRESGHETFGEAEGALVNSKSMET